MPECTLQEIYKSPWGIVASRRADVEGASYGGFGKIMDEEIAKQFIAIESVAELMDVHESTARRWVSREDPRFITRGFRKLYCREDVQAMIATRLRQKSAGKSSVSEAA